MEDADPERQSVGGEPVRSQGGVAANQRAQHQAGRLAADGARDASGAGEHRHTVHELDLIIGRHAAVSDLVEPASAYRRRFSAGRANTRHKCRE